MKKRLYLIDGSGFIFRAFYALPKLTRSDGTPCGAVYGFISMLLKLLEDKRSQEVEDHVAVIFDAGRQSFRNELYVDYKANRDEPPEELRPQFALVREATKAMGLPGIEMAGFEADDLIASYTQAAAAQNYEVVIVSSDKDLMQLVDDARHVALFDAMKDKPIREAEVIEKFGVPPLKVGEVLALMGDSSDNVPGVPGIGPKTAAELIQLYGDLETLLARAGEIKQNKRRETIIENADKARLSRLLVALKEDIPLPLPLEECVYRGLAQENLSEFLRVMEFKKLLERLNKPSATRPEESPVVISQEVREEVITLIMDEAALAILVKAAKEQGRVAMSLLWDGDELTGIALAAQGAAAYIPLGHLAPQSEQVGGVVDLFNPQPQKKLAANQLSMALAEKYLKPLLADAAIVKLTWRGKEDLLYLQTLGWQLSPIEDVCLLSYVLEAGLYGHELAELSQRHLSEALIEDATVLGTGRNKITFACATPEACAKLAQQKASLTLRLWHKLKRQVFEQHLLTVYDRIERPLLSVLAEMEAKGIKVDLAKLRSLSAEFAGIIQSVEKEIHALAGQEFMIGSPKQLGEILFERLNLPGGKKSKKSGQYGTGAEILEELSSQGHVIADKVLEWRQYEKLRNTYTEALERQISPRTRRVHTTFVQTIAATGRLSSTNPNLQNIPIRSEAGKRIREAFIADQGYDLISADYSQIELRLLAEMADIAVLKQAFRDGQDIHAATASQMFGVPLDQMTSELRRRAKTINFGIIYGISAHGLAVRLGIDRGMAGEFIKAYFEHYPGIKAYMEAKKQEARNHGYITTLYGRRVHIAGINDSNFMRRAFAERQAINAPLQGTAADIIKKAMLVLNESAALNNKVRMLLQVHDELLFEVPEGTGPEFAPKIKKIMEHAGHLSLPLVVETGIGKNWGEIH